MVILLQNSRNRDSGTAAAELDELIHSVRAACDEFLGIAPLAGRPFSRH